MPLVGNRLLAIRRSRNIERCDAAEYFGITEDELKDIELHNSDYDIDLLLKSCDLYKTTITFLLDENDKKYHLKTPTEDDYGKFEDNILCVDKLKNPLKKDCNYIKKPANCNGPSSDYYAWRILSSDYCLNGYVTMHRIEKLDALHEGDIIVAIVLQKPVYGTFTIIEDKIFIRPINNPKKCLSLTAKGSKIMGLVKRLDITVS